MTRQIKFRAWDKVDKKMRTDILSIDVNDALSKNVFFTTGNYLPQEDAIIMQSTGLKDYKNNEVYEGDIIKFTEVDEDSAFGRTETHIGTVKWIEEIAQCRFIYKSGQRIELHFVTNFEPVIECEIIGDIYSTPELIK